MKSAEAVPLLDEVIAHLWMVRTFLKHAEEIQEDPEFLAVPRLLFDSIRAVEPARERGDISEFLRRLKGKIPKLRKSADWFAQEFRNVSPHTNYEMASVSLSGAVRRMEEIFAMIERE